MKLSYDALEGLTSEIAGEVEGQHAWQHQADAESWALTAFESAQAATSEQRNTDTIDKTNQQTPPRPPTSTTLSIPQFVCFSTPQLSVPVKTLLSSGGEHGCSGKCQPTCLPDF